MLFQAMIFLCLEMLILGGVANMSETKATGTSWTITIIGVVVTLLGWFLRPGEFGAGVMGFGLAHIVLGLLDMTRPTVRTQ